MVKPIYKNCLNRYEFRPSGKKREHTETLKRRVQWIPGYGPLQQGEKLRAPYKLCPASHSFKIYIDKWSLVWHLGLKFKYQCMSELTTS